MIDLNLSWTQCICPWSIYLFAP